MAAFAAKANKDIVVGFKVRITRAPKWAPVDRAVGSWR